MTSDVSVASFILHKGRTVEIKCFIICKCLRERQREIDTKKGSSLKRRESSATRIFNADQPDIFAKKNRQRKNLIRKALRLDIVTSSSYSPKICEF